MEQGILSCRFLRITPCVDVFILYFFKYSHLPNVALSVHRFYLISHCLMCIVYTEHLPCKSEFQSRAAFNKAFIFSTSSSFTATYLAWTQGEIFAACSQLIAGMPSRAYIRHSGAIDRRFAPTALMFFKFILILTRLLGNRQLNPNEREREGKTT